MVRAFTAILIVACASVSAAVETETPPKKIAAGDKGFFQPGLLVQGWLLADHARNTTSTFRLRRAEFAARGEILPKRIGYGLQLDGARALEGARSPTTILKDAFVSVLSSRADVSVGQFKIPVSLEASGSSSRLLFPESAVVASEYGDKRDIGVRATKKFERFGYTAAVFNGAGQNTLDTNNGKDAALRLEVYPVQGLLLSALAYGSVGNRGAIGSKDRWELDLRYERGPLLVLAEFIRARDVPRVREAVHGAGFYAAVAWMLNEAWQVALRAGQFDPLLGGEVRPRTLADKNEVRHYDLGVNHYLQGHQAKVQASYGLFHHGDRPPAHRWILAGQVSF